MPPPDRTAGDAGEQAEPSAQAAQTLNDIFAVSFLAARGVTGLLLRRAIQPALNRLIVLNDVDPVALDV